MTVAHTPQQNVVAERKDRTFVECARSMLKGKNISNGFWVEVINTTIYLKNRSLTSRPRGDSASMRSPPSLRGCSQCYIQYF